MIYTVIIKGNKILAGKWIKAEKLSAISRNNRDKITVHVGKYNTSITLTL